MDITSAWAIELVQSSVLIPGLLDMLLSRTKKGCEIALVEKVATNSDKVFFSASGMGVGFEGVFGLFRFFFGFSSIFLRFFFCLRERVDGVRDLFFR